MSVFYNPNFPEQMAVTWGGITTSAVLSISEINALEEYP